MKTDCYFSIITPTYNRAHCLHIAFQSLKSQTFTDFQWIIVDDGSTDDTENIVSGFIKESKFEIIYQKIEHGGKHIATRAAYKIASGKYSFELDSDDELYDENTLDNICSLLQSDAITCPCIGGCFIDQNDNIFPKLSTDYVDYDLNKYLDVFCSAEGMDKLNICWLMKTEYARSVLPPDIRDNLSYFPEAVINVRRALKNPNFHLRVFNQPWYRYNMYNSDSVSVNTHQTNAMWYYAKSMLETFYEYNLLLKYPNFCDKLSKTLFNSLPTNKSVIDNYKILHGIGKTGLFMKRALSWCIKQIFSVNRNYFHLLGIKYHYRRASRKTN